MTPTDIILYISSKGYTVAQTTCALCVLSKGGKVIIKQKKGAPSQEAAYNQLLETFLEKFPNELRSE